MKRFLSVVFVLLVFHSSCFAMNIPLDAPQIAAPSAILIERSTGTVLYEKESHKSLHPASVTKIMTLLLAMEAIDSGVLDYDTVLTVSEHAAQMGGSQVYLEPGEQMTVHEALKCIAVSSANDACVMLAEQICGNEDGFVSKMNERAAALGMQDTHFVNCTGLDADGHVTTAYDISLMSQALLTYDAIRQYTTIWMDSIREGSFGLSNTNKLVRFFEGCTGLKTGYTSDAGYCISASALRNNMELIAVIMNAETSASRNADASLLLNYGFSQYGLYVPQIDGSKLKTVSVINGTESSFIPVHGKLPSVLVKKSDLPNVNTIFQQVDSVEAPVDYSQKVGFGRIICGDRVLAEFPLVSPSSIEKKTSVDYIHLYILKLLMR